MASIEDQLREAAARNTELLGVLAQTDYAPPALEQQNAYIKQLEAAIASNNLDLKKLSSQREKEHKDHRKYNESVTRRFLYKASGQKDKFATKADKEEKEYFEALKAEHRAQDEREKLSKQMEEAQQGQSQLQAAAMKHDQAQKDLDALYNSIFAGETPSFPEEDGQENATHQVLYEFQRHEVMLKAEDQTLELLNQANKSMAAALFNIQDALSFSRGDMFGGGAMWDYMERSALGRSEMATNDAYRLVHQATTLSPHVQPLPGVSIAQGSLMSDVFFDNIFTDMAFHEKIKESAAGLRRAADVLKQNVQATTQRRNDLSTQMSQISSHLAEERRKLQQLREQIFARTAQPPPAYTDAAFD